MSIRGKKQEEHLLELLTILKKLDPKDVLKLIKEKEKEQKQLESKVIPVSLFAATSLSSLEAITVYLRENKGLRFSEMEKILSRNQIMLSTTYRNAKKKYAKKIEISETKYSLPCSIFSNRKLSVLENIVLYLKKEYELSNKSIGLLLKKDPRTIWTVLSRAKKKGVRT